MLLGRVVACVFQIEVPGNVIDGQRKNPITIVRLV
jgi:hypothetical protein